jgi:hypothetical protein
LDDGTAAQCLNVTAVCHAATTKGQTWTFMKNQNVPGPEVQGYVYKNHLNRSASWKIIT